MSVHEVAAEGFDREAGAYERARPGYPPDAVRWLAGHLRLAPGTVVADVPAGTGKLTRVLEPFGAALVAVEPVPAMREGLRATSPGVAVVAGAAEALPFAAGSFHAVTVAQAFHWFDAEATFHHEQIMTVDGVIERFRSVSHVAVLPPERREAVLAEVQTVLAQHPDTSGQELVPIPYRVDAYWCERRA